MDLSIFPKQFHPDVDLVVYDADVDCVAQIKEKHPRATVLPYCLSGENGKRKFIITYDPYASSLLPVNKKFGSFTHFNGLVDCIVGEIFKPMLEREVETTRLDQIREAKPNVLILDTQGTEYEILSGANLDDVVAVVTEVCFHQVYEGQKMFGDICQLMADKGFVFVRFCGNDDAEFSIETHPVSLRGRGICLFSNALFLRWPDKSLRPDLTFKLAFMALCFEQVAFAVKCLCGCNEFRDELYKLSEATKYGQFLLEFAGSAESDDYPTTFPQRHTFEESRARFQAGAGGPKHGNISLPSFFYTPTGRKVALWAYRQWRRIRLIASGSFSHPALRLRSKVEVVLGKYGFKRLRKIVRKNRLHQGCFCS